MEANPLGAAYYADRALQVAATVVENVRLARDTYRIRLQAPELARRIAPGQFLMLRLTGGSDPLLGRPLALYDTWCDADGVPLGVDVVYLVIGRMTSRLAQVRTGEVIETWGPLGNGFSTAPVDHLIMVAGGIGQTPFLALGREALGGRDYGDSSRTPLRAQRATLCYGVRTADLLAGIDDFRAAEVDVRISSDDGSVGRHGLVTETLRELLDEAAIDPGKSIRIACCGPERMMEAVAHLAGQRGVACEVSLETPMACGIGICFSCVVKVRQPDGEWDYKRTCVEGPVFAAEKIEW
jgi:dihydroorotate dehydrogenase electron transfer subunit